MELIKKILLSLCLMACTPAWATVVTFQEGVSGYAGTHDASINTGNTNEHKTVNTRTRTDAGENYVVCWDISGAAIPSSASVNSCSAQFYMSEQNCTSETVEAHIIEDPDGTDPIVSNSAEDDVFNQYTTYRFKNESGSVKWEAAGSAGFADVDDNASAGSVASGACPGSVSKSISITSACQTLISGSKNYVCLWLGINDGAGNVLIKSKRTASSSERPLLTIDYTAAAGAAAQVFHSFKNINATGNLIVK